jgi:dTDP-L-rhamnose 4-epimerase
MKILVTGGAGFIGSHTADALVDRGYDVVILDNLQKPVHLKGKPGYLNPKAEYIWGDVRDKEIFRKALKSVEAVFHFAAYQDYLPDFSKFFHVNSVGTALLYEIIVEEKLPIKKVVVASSQFVQGEGIYQSKSGNFYYPKRRTNEQLQIGQWNFLDESDALLQWQWTDEEYANPPNQYAISKYSQELMALNFGERYDIPSVALRYSIVQGARQSFYNAYSGAMRIFSLALHQGKRPIIYEDGEQIRDFVNIYDVIDANMLLMEKEKTDYQVYNVGGGMAITVNEFYKEVDSIYQTGIEPINKGYYRYGDTRHIVSDVSKLQALGWKPKRGIRDSILSYKEFLESHDNIPDVLTKSIKEMKAQSIIRQATIRS